MDFVTREQIEARLAEKYPKLDTNLVEALTTIYVELVKWHEISIKLTQPRFDAAVRDVNQTTRCLAFLLSRDLEDERSVPVSLTLRLRLRPVPEQGGGGWINVSLVFSDR